MTCVRKARQVDQAIRMSEAGQAASDNRVDWIVRGNHGYQAGCGSQVDPAAAAARVKTGKDYDGELSG
jgi:hypothetical protein